MVYSLDSSLLSVCSLCTTCIGRAVNQPNMAYVKLATKTKSTKTKRTAVELDNIANPYAEPTSNKECTLMLDNRLYHLRTSYISASNEHLELVPSCEQPSSRADNSTIYSQPGGQQAARDDDPELVTVQVHVYGNTTKV